jgi:bacterial/archaeal transporter family protein
VSWTFYAAVSALAAAATAVLAKLGVSGVPSNFAVAVRTSVVLVFAWGIAFATGEQSASLSPRALAFLIASGVGTGVSWLAYFKALSMAPASRVAPIDKLSLALTIVLAALVLREPITWKLALGVLLMVVGALLTIG